ncbi:MAG TPA: hypothetical protein VGL48_07610 [Acidimicrobiales bacterium]
MSTWITVARYHLIQRLNFLVLPWAILAFAFIICLAIFGSLHASGIGTHGNHYYAGGIATIFVVWFIAGIQTTSRSLSFALALGATRRAYYLGSITLGVTLAAVYGLGLAGLQAVERTTGGWGLRMHFFRVPYLLDGPWYLTWCTSLVGLALLYCWGIWFGLVYRRWNLAGLLAFIATQIAAFTAGALAVTWTGGWHSLDRFFTAISAAGLTGFLAALAAALIVGGLSTARRLTV